MTYSEVLRLHGLLSRFQEEFYPIGDEGNNYIEARILERALAVVVEQMPKVRQRVR